MRTLQVKKCNKNVTNCLLAFGSNQHSHVGDAVQTLHFALELIAGESLAPIARSRLFRTPAIPAGSGPAFVNSAAAFATSLSPQQVLARCHDIEARLGRTRGRRWGARVLDVDLLSCGDLILPDPVTFELWRRLSFARQSEESPAELILPHPRIQDRGFVLVPLMDIAPGWVHPVLHLTVREMHARLGPADLAEILPL